MRRRGLVAAAGALGLLAVLPSSAEEAGKPFAHTVRPRHIAEECFKLPTGQTIGYAFESSAPVDFNIHYHVGKDVVYPIKSEQVRQAVDRFTAPSDEEFCLMWTNATVQVVTIKGRLGP